jgi:uncharacterized low-complexity protein
VSEGSSRIYKPIQASEQAVLQSEAVARESKQGEKQSDIYTKAKEGYKGIGRTIAGKGQRRLGL